MTLDRILMCSACGDGTAEYDDSWSECTVPECDGHVVKGESECCNGCYKCEECGKWVSWQVVNNQICDDCECCKECCKCKEENK